MPIETGSSYLNSDSGSKLITLEEFIDKHILHGDAEVGYLAQHQLLKQIPELQKDIDIPDYCALLCDIDESVKSSADVVTVDEEDVKVQMWLGPVGTLSPLHHDCYYNLLCQVVGKFVCLCNMHCCVMRMFSQVSSMFDCIILISQKSCIPWMA